MHTFKVYATLIPQSPEKNSRGSSSLTPGPSRPSKTSALSPNISPSLAPGRTRSRRSGSTIWGPGALGGKLMKYIGESVLGAAEHVAIRKRFGLTAELQAQILGSAAPPRDKETVEKLKRRCRDLVELSIMNLGYPFKTMTHAFSLILKGFRSPGRRIWTYHVAEALSKREEIQDVHDIFEYGFFPLLNESIFRLHGYVDLEILRYRCPPVAHEVVTIISHLSRIDRMVDPLYVPVGASSSSLSRVVSPSSPLFSTMIIRAFFFDLVRDWETRGFPHWDNLGKEMLEQALQDIADAQNSHGDPEGYAAEALELKDKLQSRRSLLLPEIRRTDSWLEPLEEFP